ncbi:cytochrome P450 [Plantactinospora siamensis]|uniref:Cytochrome P450 n=1 Tax=Plantactinospora siamensis TaxID=555372 RepID=A0ABV6P4P3_9ACTN
MTVSYNPLDPEFVANPYPVLKELRESAPAYQIMDGLWLLTRHHDIDEVLRDREGFTVDHRKLSAGPAQNGVPYESIANILFRDPPEHTRWRRQMARALTPAHIEAFRPRAAGLVDELLDAIGEKGETEFIEAFAGSLPFLAISELLGTPVADRPQLHAWTSDIVNITEPIASPEVSAAIVRSSDEMRAYLTDLCAHKRTHPADDVISRLVAADGDDHPTPEEAVEHVLLLQVAAPEPTTNHLAFGALELARHPDQARVLRDDPSLDNDATEELLRYEAPLQIAVRGVLRDTELHGEKIQAGAAVVMSIAAANHDAERWGDTADDLDLRRNRPQDHLSFARGIHTCFGAALARLLGQETFGRLARRFPDLTLTADPQWNILLNRRGPTQVPISVR